jgi:hypothetical protein
VDLRDRLRRNARYSAGLRAEVRTGMINFVAGSKIDFAGSRRHQFRRNSVQKRVVGIAADKFRANTYRHIDVATG